LKHSGKNSPLLITEELATPRGIRVGREKFSVAVGPDIRALQGDIERLEAELRAKAGTATTSSGPITNGASILAAVESNSALSQALVGKTIAGLVVAAIEVYADGAIYDTANNRFLSPGSFAVDPAVFHRSGLS
jgi:hypothetical protein